MGITLLLIDLFKQIPKWDKPSQTALSLAVLFLVAMIGVMIFGSDDIRQPAMIGFVGLIIVIQVIFLWGNRTLVTAYTQAQRHFLQGDFENARQTLESEVAENHENFEYLTLLGNTYRQLGKLSQSEKILRQAVQLAPNHHFPAYGLGRALLAQGEFQEAMKYLKDALKMGAPPNVTFDIGHTLYHAGKPNEAMNYLQESLEFIGKEPHRLLMAQWLLYLQGLYEHPSDAIIQDGLPYWQEVAQRLSKTPYGLSIQFELDKLSMLVNS